MNDLEINNLAERIAKGKPLNVLIRILTFVSALAGIMSMFFCLLERLCTIIPNHFL